MRALSSLVLLLAALPAAAAAPVAPAAAGSGTLQGRVDDGAGQPVKGALVRLQNKVSGYRETVRTGADGRFTFFNVPFNNYHLEAGAPGFTTAHRNLEIRTGVAVEADLSLGTAAATVTIQDTSQLVEATPAAHVDITQSVIDSVPTTSQTKGLENIILQTPGFAQDADGRFHFRGSHGQVTYVIDGVPVTDQMAGGSGPDPDQVDSLEVVTGGISAEYGGKPAAVINLTTKTGLGQTGIAGDVFASTSRFSAFEGGVNLRGGTGTFGYFVSGLASTTDRFQDPVTFGNLHNHGQTGRLYTRFDWLLGDKDTIRLSLGGGRTDRDVVNLPSQEARGMDQAVRDSDASLSLGWAHVFDDHRTLETTAFYRHGVTKLDPTADLQPGFAAGGPDFPIWVKQDRSLDNQGLQSVYTQQMGQVTVKAGASYIRYPIHERFAFAITDPNQVTDPTDPLYPYTPAGGGNLFRFDEGLTPTLASAFLQSDWKLTAWRISAGLRYDRYTQRSFTQGQLQPRLGLAYTVPVLGTVLRASYDRLMITPENENLALSLNQQARDLGAQAGTPAPPLASELQDSFSYGAEQQLGQVGRISLDYWEKRSKDAADNEQFFNTGIVFPVAAARGLFRGWDLRFDLVPIHGFSAYLSLGHTRAIFETPTVGGLLLEAPVAPGTRYLIDHDEKLNGQLGLRYEQPSWFIQAQARYDSGLVAGDPAGISPSDPDYGFGLAYIEPASDGLGNTITRVKPRTVWDLNGGRTFKLSETRSLEIGADLLNAFDRKALYNFLSTYGGTHVIAPRTLAVHVKFKF
ncbi:MAG TPA: TonB-dependent receptor [Holophagaceae bacterium]|nr:TonB-dependent receptor [Holophagaceae bacterium]